MTNTELLTKFFDAENARDWDIFRGFLHPEVMWFLHTEKEHTMVVGREEYFDRVVTGYRDASADDTFTCERMEVSDSGNRIVATLKKSNGGRSVDVFDFEDGMIRWEYEYTLD